MELKIVTTTTIYIDINDIIERHHLTSETSNSDINDAILDYVCGLDDCEYYLIGDNEIKKIAQEIRSWIGEQMTLPL